MLLRVDKSLIKYDWPGTEHNLQKACAEFCDLHVDPAVVWTSIDQQNQHTGGNKRIAIYAAKQRKARGVKAGFLDMQFFWKERLGPWHPQSSIDDIQRGLFLELKKKGGSLQPKQKEIAQKLIDAGYYFAVARSLQELYAVLKYYRVPMKPGIRPIF